MAIPIEKDVLEILKSSTLKDNLLYLPDQQLDKALYQRLNKALVAIGGKWNSSKKAHVFSDDPSLALELMFETGTYIDLKKDMQFFATPEPIVKMMIDVLDCPWGKILEPSAGSGAIAQAIAEKIEIYKAEYQMPETITTSWKDLYETPTLVCCEAMNANKRILEKKGFNVVCDDFLKYHPEHKYDAIVMNPPFNVEGDSTAYITHIMHAWSLLKEGGQLLAITPSGWLTSSIRKQKEFREFVFDFLSFETIDRGTFKESGTNVSTMFIYGRKEKVSSGREPHQGAPSYFAWHFILLAENDQKTIQNFYTPLDKHSFIHQCESYVRIWSQENIGINLNEEDYNYMYEYFKEFYWSNVS